MHDGIVFIVLACTVGFWMTWAVGANDLANIISTAMGSRALTLKQALFIAIIFEVAGAFLGGNEVSDTIRGGILNISSLSDQPLILIYVLLSVLFAGAAWITFASALGMPVSITNAIVGALVGVGTLALGLKSIHWQIVGYIVLSWICSPAIAGMIAFLLFISIRRFILGANCPLKAAKYYIPIYFFLVGIVLSMMTVLKGLHHFKVAFNSLHKFEISLLTSIIISLFGIHLIKKIPLKNFLDRHQQFIYIEAMFSILMAFTACAMVFAHGSNDVAIAVGPVAGIISLVSSGQPMHDDWLLSGIMLAGCMGVVIGLFMYGRKVMETVGNAITLLTPSRAFAATFAAASTVVLSTSTGIPVSATQTLVGAIFGVGLARGIDALNLNVIRNIFMSWLVTIPAAAFIATVVFNLLRYIFS